MNQILTIYEALTLEIEAGTQQKLPKCGIVSNDISFRVLSTHFVDLYKYFKLSVPPIDKIFLSIKHRG